MDIIKPTNILLLTFISEFLTIIYGATVTNFGYNLSYLTTPPIQSNSYNLPKRELAYLLSNAVVEDSAIMAFSAFAFMSDPITLQIYRPINASIFILVDQFIYTPSVLNKRENIYVESVREKCMRVKAGDRLAVYSQTGNLGVQHLFQPNKPLTIFSEPNQNFKINSSIVFSTITPYDIYVAAYAYKLKESESCLYNQILPEYENVYLTTPLPVTGKPGIAGEQGLVGKAGPTGQLGQIGFTGQVGNTGRKSDVNGPQGPLGDPGLIGDTGDIGLVGPPGKLGQPGEIGSNGETGQNGWTGSPGKNLYIVGPQKNDTTDIIASTVQEQKYMTTPKAVWAAFIWAAILSLFAIIVLIIIITLYCFRIRIKEE